MQFHRLASLEEFYRISARGTAKFLLIYETGCPYCSLMGREIEEYVSRTGSLEIYSLDVSEDPRVQELHLIGVPALLRIEAATGKKALLVGADRLAELESFLG